MRIVADGGELASVFLLLTHDALELLEEEARSLRLSDNATHAHVSAEDYQTEITLVLAAKRTRGGFNEAVNALVERIDPRT